MLRRFTRILTENERRKFRGGTILLSLSAFLDLFSLLAVLPLFQLLMGTSSPDFLPEGLTDFIQDQGIGRLLLFLVVLFSAKNALTYFINRNAQSFCFELSQRLISDQLIAYLKRGYYHFRGKKQFELGLGANQLPRDFATRGILVLMKAIAESSLLVFILILGLIAKPGLSLGVLLTIFPLVLLLRFQMAKKSQQLGKERNEIGPHIYNRLHRLLNSFIELRNYGASDFFLNRYLHSQNQLKEILKTQQRMGLIPGRMLEVLIVCGASVLFLYQSGTGKTNEQTLLSLTAFALIAYRLLPAASNVANAIMNLGSIQNNAELMELNLSLQRKGSSANISSIQSGIVLREVSFGYESTALLDGLNLEIPKGSITGIKGLSGSGKSTLLKLIMGFIEPTNGEITIDGHKVSELSQESYRLFAYIGEGSSLFDGDIYANISLKEKCEEKDRNKIDRILNRVQLGQYSGSTKNAGEDGAFLSSGEKQRLALARALYHGSEVLILDEFTSNLDEQNESALLVEVGKLNREEGLTIIIVSHRSAPLTICQRVLELKGGQLHSSGASA